MSTSPNSSPPPPVIEAAKDYQEKSLPRSSDSLDLVRRDDAPIASGSSVASKSPARAVKYAKPDIFHDMCRGKTSLMVVRTVAKMDIGLFEKVRNFVRDYNKDHILEDNSLELDSFISAAESSVPGLNLYEDAWPAVVCYKKTIAQRKESKKQTSQRYSPFPSTSEKAPRQPGHSVHQATSSNPVPASPYVLAGPSVPAGPSVEHRSPESPSDSPQDLDARSPRVRSNHLCVVHSRIETLTHLAHDLQDRARDMQDKARELELELRLLAESLQDSG